ncbi:MAG: hypothetical protein JWL61_5007 [Gemmatimonadetes bacterium]|nr:hypothetical protein [Gemmatimonadota bacterium]
MSTQDWFGSGSASPRELAERIVTEAVRRAKLEAQNDPNFVPTASDASNILAARRFVLPPAVQERGSNDANDVIASRVLTHVDPTASSGTPLNVPWTLVQRDVNGDFAASTVQVVALKSTTHAGYDFALYAPDGTTYILRVPTGTQDVELLAALKTAQKITVQAGGVDVTGNSTITGTLNVTGAITGTASLANALSHANQNVAGAGSSVALHNLITALIAAGIDLTDSTTP